MLQSKVPQALKVYMGVLGGNLLY